MPTQPDQPQLRPVHPRQLHHCALPDAVAAPLSRHQHNRSCRSVPHFAFERWPTPSVPTALSTDLSMRTQGDFLDAGQGCPGEVLAAETAYPCAGGTAVRPQSELHEAVPPSLRKGQQAFSRGAAVTCIHNVLLSCSFSLSSSWLRSESTLSLSLSADFSIMHSINNLIIGRWPDGKAVGQS
jgi:hypothetical protein